MHIKVHGFLILSALKVCHSAPQSDRHETFSTSWNYHDKILGFQNYFWGGEGAM